MVPQNLTAFGLSPRQAAIVGVVGREDHGGVPIRNKMAAPAVFLGFTQVAKHRVRSSTLEHDYVGLAIG